MNDNTIYTIETNISNPGGIVVNPNNSVLYYASEIFKIYEFKFNLFTRDAKKIPT